MEEPVGAFGSSRLLPQRPQSLCSHSPDTVVAGPDGCPDQDINFSGRSACASDAVIDSAANLCNHAPPTQLVPDTKSVDPADQRIEDQSKGNGTTAASRRAEAKVHADSAPLSGDGELRAPQSFEEESARQRALHFFFGVAGGPTATGDGGLALACTLALILTVHKARDYLWKHRRAEIKAMFAPERIDKQEVFAFLLIDALGRPLLHKGDARGVGQRGDNGLAKAEQALASAKQSAYSAVRAARKAAESDPGLIPGIAAAEAAGVTAKSRVLATPYDLKLPDRTPVVTKRKREPLTLEEQLKEAEEATRAAENIFNKANVDADSKSAHWCSLPTPTEEESYRMGWFEACLESASGINDSGMTAREYTRFCEMNAVADEAGRAAEQAHTASEAALESLCAAEAVERPLKRARFEAEQAARAAAHARFMAARHERIARQEAEDARFLASLQSSADDPYRLHDP